MTVFWGRLFVLLERNKKPARQMFLYQHILEIHNSEIRVNSQHSSLLKCTFPAYDIWETWEQDHVTDTIFEFLKIFCASIFFVIRHGCIYQEISNSDVHKYPYTSLSCENRNKEMHCRAGKAHLKSARGVIPSSSLLYISVSLYISVLLK